MFSATCSSRTELHGGENKKSFPFSSKHNSQSDDVNFKLTTETNQWRWSSERPLCVTYAATSDDGWSVGGAGKEGRVSHGAVGPRGRTRARGVWRRGVADRTTDSPSRRPWHHMRRAAAQSSCALSGFFVPFLAYQNQTYSSYLRTKYRPNFHQSRRGGVQLSLWWVPDVLKYVCAFKVRCLCRNRGLER